MTTLVEMRAQLQAALSDLSRRSAAGENVGGDVAQMQAALSRVESAMAAAGEPAGGGDDFLPAVMGERAPSRFAGAGADPEALAALAAGRDVDGLRVQGRSLGSPGGSLGGMMSKALAEGTGSAGGFLVPVEIADDVMGQLRAQSVVYASGARHLPVRKELDVVSLSSGATAGYGAENSLIAVSEETFASAPLLVPKRLAALVPVSNKLLLDSAGEQDVDRIIREDLAEIMALRFDLAALRGTGSASEPTGILNQAGVLTEGSLGIVPAMGANGRAVTFDDLKLMVAACRAQNARFRRPGWVFNASVLSSIERLKDADGAYLADRPNLLSYDATGGGGTLLGFPFRTTSQLIMTESRGTSSDATTILFGSDWDELWVGESGSLRLQLSGEATWTTDAGATWQSAYQQDVSVFRTVAYNDVKARRPSLFVKLPGVRPLGA